jgi:hypothetical protein
LKLNVRGLSKSKDRKARAMKAGHRIETEFLAPQWTPFTFGARDEGGSPH